jgi:glutathionyl-hydroquinone reductase
MSEIYTPIILTWVKGAIVFASCGTDAKLGAYRERMLALPAVAATVHLDHVKRGSYSIKALNPSRIVPLGPELPFRVPA